eukprot:PhM_4_TR17056/c1_g1_i2/m.90391
MMDNGYVCENNQHVASPVQAGGGDDDKKNITSAEALPPTAPSLPLLLSTNLRYIRNGEVVVVAANDDENSDHKKDRLWKSIVFEPCDANGRCLAPIVAAEHRVLPKVLLRSHKAAASTRGGRSTSMLHSRASFVYYFDPSAVAFPALIEMLTRCGGVPLAPIEVPQVPSSGSRRQRSFSLTQKQKVDRGEEEEDGDESGLSFPIELASLCWAKRFTMEQFRILGRITSTTTAAKAATGSSPLAQKGNHFPGSWCLGRKDNLHRTLSECYNNSNNNNNSDKRPLKRITPTTFVMPGEMRNFERLVHALRSSASKETRKTLFVLKPVGLAGGTGISVGQGHVILQRLGDPKRAGKGYVVQEYIDRPLLIENRKWDMRVYVVAMNYDPLRAYVYPEGLGRFASLPYHYIPTAAAAAAAAAAA